MTEAEKGENEENEENIREVHTIFDFDLPFVIPKIPDGIYNVTLDGNTAQISIKRKQRERVGRLVVGGQFAEIEFDKYGRGSYSHVRIKFPEQMDLKEEGRKPLLLDILARNKAKETVIRYMNRFIEAVRYITGEYHLEPIAYSDILSYKIFHWDGQTLRRVQEVELSTGTGGLRLGLPPRLENEKLELLKDLLETEKTLDIANVFILNAKDSCLKEDFRLAIVEAVTALETKLFEFIIKRSQQLNISKTAFKRFKREVGLSSSISVVLKMLTENLEEIDEDKISKCKGAITERNKILHEGLIDIEPRETEERIEIIEQVIEYLDRLIKSVERELEDVLNLSEE